MIGWKYLGIGFLLISLYSHSAFAQQKTITGTVSNEAIGPILGVNVSVSNTRNGVVTDFDGKYSILVNEGDVLVFSYVGYLTENRTVGANVSVINVSLKENVESLEGVVVTGYQNIEKQLFTGAAQTLKGDEIKLDGVADVSRLLEGRAAGVTVQNVSGTFGTAPRITIRGSSSILGDTQPLWIVDGAIQEGIVNIGLEDLTSGDSSTLLGSVVAGLNAADIESIDILRDASATALYGARALNGVVVITTKTGKRNQANRVNYTSEYTVRTKPNYSQFDLLNSQETVSVYRELENKGFLNIAGSLQNRFGGIYNLLYREINTFNPATGGFNLVNTPEARASFLQKYELANTDWFDELFRTTPTQTHSLSFSGGGENNTSYASLSYYTDPGWTIADRVRRLTGNIQNSYYLAEDKLKLTFQLQTSFRDQNAPGTFNSQDNTVTGQVNRDFDINPFSYALNTSRAIRPRDDNGNLEYVRYNWAPFNILDEINNNSLNIKVTDLRFRTAAEYKITPDITYNFLATARYAFSTTEQRITEQSNVAGAYRADETTIVRDQNIFLFDDPANPNSVPRVVLPVGGILRNTENKIETYTFRNTLDIKKSIDDIHNFRVYLGQEYRTTDRSETFNTGYGIQFDRGGVPFTDPDILRKVILEGTDYFGLLETRERGVTFFLNTTYDYDQKYVLNLTGNYDGSNRAGRSASARWLPTFNIAGRYNIHKEEFMQDVDWVNNLAIRPSYGLVGLLADAASNNLAIFQNSITDRQNQQDRENFINILDLQNSELTYEKTLEFNLGLDIGLFNNAVTINADAYVRKGSDLIDLVRTSGIGGEFIKLGNNAEMTTKGIEFQVGTRNITTDDFSWKTSFNISAFDQKITKLLQRPNVFDLVDENGGNVVGFPRGSIFSFDFDGLNEDGLPTFNLGVDGDGNPVNTLTGIDFQAVDNISDYLKYEGGIEPNFSGGLANNFTYKNFDFGVFVTFSAGNKIRLTPTFASRYTDLSVFSQDFTDRWLLPGDEARTNIPVIASTQLITEYGANVVSRAYNAYNFSDQRIADGGYVRLRNISVGYSFPETFRKTLNLTQFRLSAQATNPFLIYSDSKLNGQDPEFIRSGGVASPVPKQYTLSLNVGF